MFKPCNKVTPPMWEVILIRLEFLYIHEHAKNSIKYYVAFHSFNIREICYHENQSRLAMVHEVVLTKIIHEKLCAQAVCSCKNALSSLYEYDWLW